MSVWTHVNGSIRIDTHEWYDREFKNESLSSVLSKFYGDFNNRVPSGSEGPLTLNHSFTFVASNQAFVTLSFSGDLRDYEKEDVNNELIIWVKNITEGQSVRQGFVEIEVEQDCYINMQYVYGAGWKIKESISE